jgi:hypothetical protein
MWMQKQSKYENMAYVALWGLLFAAPLLSLYVRTTGDDGMAFNWQEAFMVWRRLAVFLLIFLVHNFFLAPLLIHRQKRWQYALLTVCMIGLFTFYQCQQRPPMARGFNHEPPPFEHREDFPKHREDGPRHPDHFPKHHRDVPPAIIGEHDIIAIVILILMLGANLGIKSYFKTREDQKKLLRLEKENLEQQLEYLKYQINPHFFMNTLNNIHALVDIDAEKAKSTILELSKMMRFVLYEGDKKGVPLTREFGFIRNYITLMRLRYTDKVQISIDLPEQSPDLMIPPLMLITFIENAFKHGVSYQHDSFIEVKAEVQGDTLHFSCRNSKAEKPNEEKGGVGLANVKQRLKLLYDNDYSLKIQDDSDIYSVQLTIPLS